MGTLFALSKGSGNGYAWPDAIEINKSDSLSFYGVDLVA